MAADGGRGPGPGLREGVRTPPARPSRRASRASRSGGGREGPWQRSAGEPPAESKGPAFCARYRELRGPLRPQAPGKAVAQEEVQARGPTEVRPARAATLARHDASRGESDRETRSPSF